MSELTLSNARRSAVKKWEYLFVRFDYFAGDLRPKSVNEKDFRDKQDIPPLHELSNQLGQEGWELTGVNSHPGYGYGFLIFKRPKDSL